MANSAAVRVRAADWESVRTTKTKRFQLPRRLPALRPTGLLRYRDVRIACNLQCLVCSRVFRSSQGLGSHLYSQHGIASGHSVHGTHWDITGKQAILPRKRPRIIRVRKVARSNGQS